MLKDEIKKLIALKQEGAYWDFKREWYSKDKKGKDDMLHDIICMANNTKNRDAYIIIGIDEEKDFNPVNVKIGSNRRTTQNIVDFLREKPFANERPIAKVQSIDLEEGTIDVIIIKNGRATPYYLKEPYGRVNPNNIYSRIGDTNTPIDKSADYNVIRNLWMKNFGLLLTPMDKVGKYLQKKDDWEKNNIYNNNIIINYYKKDPSYTIKQTFLYNKKDYEYYLFTQEKPRPYWSRIEICYLQTVLFTTTGIALDGYNCFVPTPEKGMMIIGFDVIQYGYIIKNSLLDVLYKFFCYKWYDPLTTKEYDDNFKDSIILFESDQEKKDFEEFIQNNWKKKDEYKKRIDPDKYKYYYQENDPTINVSFYKEITDEIQILQRMFKEFKKDGLPS